MFTLRSVIVWQALVQLATTPQLSYSRWMTSLEEGVVSCLHNFRRHLLMQCNQPPKKEVTPAQVTDIPFFKAAYGKLSDTTSSPSRSLDTFDPHAPGDRQLNAKKLETNYPPAVWRLLAV